MGNKSRLDTYGFIARPAAASPTRTSNRIDVGEVTWTWIFGGWKLIKLGCELNKKTEGKFGEGEMMWNVQWKTTNTYFDSHLPQEKGCKKGYRLAQGPTIIGSRPLFWRISLHSVQQLFCVEIWRRRLVSHLHVMLAISVMFFSLGSSLYTWHDFKNIVMSASQGRNLMVIPLSSHLLLVAIPFLGYLISGGVCNRPPNHLPK